MKTTIITVGSITLAQKARKLLSNGGFKTKLIKLNSAKSGCEYGVGIMNYLPLDVARILREGNITYSIFGVDENDIPR